MGPGAMPTGIANCPNEGDLSPPEAPFLRAVGIGREDGAYDSVIYDTVIIVAAVMKMEIASCL